MTPKRKVHRAHGSRRRTKPFAESKSLDLTLPNADEIVAASSRPPALTSSTQPIEVDGARDISVISSSRINHKVEQITGLLRQGDQTILKIHSKGRAVGKLVSVVEIAKRALLRDGEVHCFQYSTASTVLVEKQRPQSKEEKTEQSSDGDDGSDDFEFMADVPARARLAQPLRVAIPVLTIWLSRQSHSLLKQTYGEQSTKV